jgi:hypothetical protein
VASQFLHSSWEQFSSIAWATPLLIFFKTCRKLTMVRLLQQQLPRRSNIAPYDEEKPAIWFHLIEGARFAVAGIKSQKLRNANAVASLLKQVLRGILDTVDVCIESDQPFDLLKEVLLGQLGKSKCQS